MLILLPPSEGKVQAGAGAALDLSALTFPELEEPRRAVMAELEQVSAAPDALAALGAGASLAAEVRRNLNLHANPASAAHQVYTGVLFDALGYPTLGATAARKAREHVLVFSALWGTVRLADKIPAYRLSIGTNLGKIGPLAGFWRQHLTPALDALAGTSLVLDARSSGYAGMWHAAPERTVKVNVFQLRGGVPKVVSHFAKHTRGELVRHLLQRSGKLPDSADALTAAANELPEKFRADFVPAKGGTPNALNLTVPEGVSFAKRG